MWIVKLTTSRLPGVAAMEYSGLSGAAGTGVPPGDVGFEHEPARSVELDGAVLEAHATAMAFERMPPR